jgi:hypothetical protein
MQALLDLADETGLEVRTVRSRPGSDDPPIASAMCRVKGRIWVVLSQADSVDVQLAVLAGALVHHSGEALNDRYLPPAVRALMDAQEQGEGPG